MMIDQFIQKAYRDILDKNPRHVLGWAGVMKDIRERANNSFAWEESKPIHVIYEDEILLPNSFMNFAHLLKKYSEQDGRCDVDQELNHFRLTRVLDDVRFEQRFRIEYRDFVSILDRCPQFLEVDGFVAEEQIFSDNKIVPVVYIRSSLDTFTLEHVKIHEDAHAFSMGWEKPEALYGYWRYDDGEGELLVRDHLDEYIANLESDEELSDPHKPILYVCGTHYGFRRYKKMLKENKTAIEEAQTRIKNRKDLAYLLRVIPAQEMKKMLPCVVKHYNNDGLSSVNRELLSK